MSGRLYVAIVQMRCRDFRWGELSHDARRCIGWRAGKLAYRFEGGIGGAEGRVEVALHQGRIDHSAANGAGHWLGLRAGHRDLDDIAGWDSTMGHCFGHSRPLLDKCWASLASSDVKTDPVRLTSATRSERRRGVYDDKPV